MKKKIIPGIAMAILVSAMMMAGCSRVQTDTEKPAADPTPVAEDTAQEETEEEVEETSAAKEGEKVREEPLQAEEDQDVSEEAETEEEQDTAGEANSGLTGCVVYDGEQKEVSLAKIVSQNKVTMLNFWGTFCGPCIQEMPDLADIERDYKDKGFEIVGITVDAVDYNTGKLDAHVIQDAEDIMKDTGVEYPVVYAGNDILEYAEISVVPTTFFVDAKGNIIAGPIPGSNSRSGWEKVINELLK